MSTAELMTTETVSPPKTNLRMNESPRIVREVLERLGRPEALYRVDAKRMWGNQYRVNVYCVQAEDQPVKGVRISDSFFVTMSDEGLVSQPTITRKY